MHQNVHTKQLNWYMQLHFILHLDEYRNIKERKGKKERKEKEAWWHIGMSSASHAVGRQSKPGQGKWSLVGVFKQFLSYFVLDEYIPT